MSVESLKNVPLACPSKIELAANSASEPRSWIQVARTGSFTSNRYGRFSITETDLSQMLHNFTEVTPKAPTELPVDYDHLSMDPKAVGDGIAAGWIKSLELRADGTELWAEVAWTPDAAERIQNREYQFVSPSFVKDHTHKNGEKIGTTLIAAAITNHPFLEGMKALTLFNFSAMGDLAVTDTPGAIIEREMHCAEAGQRLTFASDPELTPELTPEERALTVIVKSKIGDGDDQVVRVTTLDGDELGWFRMNQFAPADAPQKKENSPMPPKTQPDVQLSAKSAEQQLINLANTIHATEGLELRAATIEAGKRLRTQAESYLEGSRQGEAPIAPAASEAPLEHPRIDDSAVMPVVQRLAAEHGLNLKTDLWKVLKLRTEGEDRAALESYREAVVGHAG